MTSYSKLTLAGLLATTVLTAPGVVLAQSTASPPPAEQPPEADSAAQEETQVDEIVVRGRYIPNEKRTTSEVSQVLTAEAIARTGDSDIAQALTRVTGLSLVGNGFVYVRGLGERYSSTLLDGSVLPSPEPLRRVVPLDIFPTSFLASTLVQKTYSAEYPAEFGGGVIVLRTRAIPNGPFLQASTSLAYNDESTGKRGNFVDYGNNAFLGFGDHDLEFPGLFRVNPNLTGYTGENRQALARSLRNVWSFDRETTDPDFGLRVTGGTNFDLAGMNAGFLALVDYGSQTRLRNGPRRNYSASNAGLQLNEDLSPEGCLGVNTRVAPSSCGVFRTNWDVSLNALGAFGLDLNENNHLKFTSLVLRKTTQEARLERGSFSESPGTILSRQQSNFIEQQLWTNQLTGEHIFSIGGPLPDAELTWRAVYGKANRDTPYRREYTYAADGTGAFRWDLSQGRNSTIFSALEDENYEGGVDLKLEGLLFDREATVKFGALATSKDREFLQRRYQFNLQQNIGCGVIPVATLQSVPEIILSPDNIGAVCGFTIASTSDNSDQFQASVDVQAAYASAELQVTEDIRWTLGVRGEHSEQSVDTFQAAPAGSTFVPVNVDLEKDYVLPATTLTWEFADGFQARAGFSQTLARPDLRELAPSQFFDVDNGTTESGNPRLQVTEINNYDARVEWYFGDRRSATLGVFYKQLDKPIERTFFFTGEGPTRSLANADDATLKGVEAEFDVSLPFNEWTDMGFIVDRDWYLIGNVTYIDSSVTRSLAEFPTVTRRNGPLQGQSEYLANLQFGYDSQALREKANLSLNYQDERIFGVGIQGIPDTIETPPLMLDFNFTKAFDVLDRTLEAGLKVNNILGEEYELSQGGNTTETYKLGTTVQLSLTATF